MKKSSKIAIILFVFVVLTTFMLPVFVTNDIYARYVTSVTDSDNARVAKFQIEHTGITTLSLNLTNINPGYDQSHTFTITNLSEVSVKAKIYIKTSGNFPLEFYINDTLVTNDNPYITSVIGSNQTAPTNFTLKIKWPANLNESKYANFVDAISLIASVEQVD